MIILQTGKTFDLMENSVNRLKKILLLCVLVVALAGNVFASDTETTADTESQPVVAELFVTSW